MPGFAQKLTDDEIAAVLTYTRAAFGNAADPVAASRIASVRKDLRESH